MPALSALQRELGSKDFEVVAISLDRKGAEAAATFLKETKANDLALYLYPSAAALDQLQAMGLPATVLIDRKGNVRYLHKGYKAGDEGEYLNQIRALLKE